MPHFMTQRLKNFVKEHSLFDKDDKLLLAVSGGVDSVVLAWMLKELQFDFAIAHCNFQLRDDESDEDARFVESLSAYFKVPFFCKQFDTRNEAAKSGISIQMGARQLRYKWFKELCAQENFSFILTAHHQNDLLETVLLNLVRGTGLAGFHGIFPKRGNVVRPLLFANREDIESFASEKLLKWREDSSNASNKYARNLIRNEIVPHLKKLNPSLENTIKHTGEMVGMLESFAYDVLQEKTKDIICEEEGRLKIAINHVIKEKHGLLILSTTLANYGFSYETTRQIVASSDAQSGKIFQSPTHRLLKDRNYWIIEEKHSDISFHKTVNEGERELFLPNGQSLTFEVLEGGIESVMLIEKKRKLFLDYAKLSFPLSIRNWEEGDEFVPFGMKGTKKISDFLVDLKVDLFKKERIAVLLSGQEVVGVIGYRPSQRYAVDNFTSRIFVLTVL